MRKEEKLQRAIALGYDPKSHYAPVVKATGKGHVAERILEAAKKHNVPIQSDPSLVALLGELDVNEQIPPDLFNVVAEVFALVYRADKTAKTLRNRG
ncbi:MAG: EscU/YscU/HrcU family type III secretion system export apparatus switch protein [Bacilli bacterium]